MFLSKDQKENLASTLTPKNSRNYANATCLFDQEKTPENTSFVPLILGTQVNLKEDMVYCPFLLQSEGSADTNCSHVDQFYNSVCLPVYF